MKKSLYSILSLVTIITLACSCSSEESTYNPFAEQEKSPFYPQEIIVEKQNNKIDISEKWSFEYTAENKIKAYTHETTTKLETKNGTETTIKTENGKLSYYPNGDIHNEITLETNFDGPLNSAYKKDIINEDATCEDGRITDIKRQIRSYNDRGEMTTSVTNRTFTYTDSHCTSSTYTDAYNADGPITHTYTYSWDSYHKLTGVEVNEKEENTRANKVFKYEYDKIDKDRGFHTNAFIYNHLPEIYAAMGYFGEDCPYTIYHEEQNFRLFIEGTWEKDNSADSKLFTILENKDNEFKYDISSDIYNTNYYIKFIK